MARPAPQPRVDNPIPVALIALEALGLKVCQGFAPRTPHSEHQADDFPTSQTCMSILCGKQKRQRKQQCDDRLQLEEQ